MTRFPDLREPSARDAAVHVAMTVGEYSLYILMAVIVVAFWVVT
jgi:hypothetical protein